VNVRNNAVLALNNSANTFSASLKAPSALAASYTITLPANDGNANQFLQTDGSGVTTWATGGDVVGPASSVDNTIARYNLATGKLIQGSGVLITDGDVLALPTAVASRDVVYTSTTAIDMSASDYFEIQTPTITHVGNTTADIGAATSGSITLPTMLQNDVCIVCISSDGGTTLTTSSTGWTAQPLVGTDAYLRVYTKVMGATPDTTFTVTGVSVATVMQARAYRGSSGVDSCTTATNTAGMPDAPATFTSFANSFVVIFGGLDDDAAITSSAPANFSGYLATESALTKTTLYSAHRDNVTGFIDPGIFPSATGTDAWSAATVVLNPGSYGALTFSSVPNVAISGYTGNANVMTKIFYVTGGGRLDWPASVTWIEGIAPQGTPYLASLTTLNGGTEWIGSHASRR
jgi:hypothetical protein